MTQRFWKFSLFRGRPANEKAIKFNVIALGNWNVIKGSFEEYEEHKLGLKYKKGQKSEREAFENNIKKCLRDGGYKNPSVAANEIAQFFFDFKEGDIVFLYGRRGEIDAIGVIKLHNNKRPYYFDPKKSKEIFGDIPLNGEIFSHLIDVEWKYVGKIKITNKEIAKKLAMNRTIVELSKDDAMNIINDSVKNLIKYPEKNLSDAEYIKSSSGGSVEDVGIDEEKEQDEILAAIRDEYKDKDSIIEDLKKINYQEPEFVNIRGKRYRRDNKTIAQLKILRDFKCQICNTSIKKKNGEFYIEAAHITEKSKKGPETPDNILILCPNHHKEFDLGNKEIKERTKDKIKFVLNNKEYAIDLTLK